jgi:hypothetical protein
MQLLMLPSLLRPSTMVLMVAEGDETAAFRLCSCSSSPVLLERGLEGTLTDLMWYAILRIDESYEATRME